MLEVRLTEMQRIGLLIDRLTIQECREFIEPPKILTQVERQVECF